MSTWPVISEDTLHGVYAYLVLHKYCRCGIKQQTINQSRVMLICFSTKMSPIRRKTPNNKKTTTKINKLHAILGFREGESQ